MSTLHICVMINKFFRSFSNDAPQRLHFYFPVHVFLSNPRAFRWQFVNELHRLISGRPSHLQNCTVMNQTSESLQIECTEGFDGGLPQSFLMEVLELPSLKSKSNVTTYKTPPVFYIEGLEPGASYRIKLYALNAKGKSDATVIDPVTIKGVLQLQGR